MITCKVNWHGGSAFTSRSGGPLIDPDWHQAILWCSVKLEYVVFYGKYGKSAKFVKTW